MTCLNNTTILGCYERNPGEFENVVLHYIYDNQGQPAVVVTNLEGDVEPSADPSNVRVGACTLGDTVDVEFEILCDIPVGPGPVVRFIRRTIVTVYTNGDPPLMQVADFEMDYTNPYTPTGDIGACSDCPELQQRGLIPGWN